MMYELGFAVGSSLTTDSRGHGENFDPFALNGVDVLKFWDFDGRSVVERDVGTQEVVMSGEEDDERQGAVVGLEAAGGTNMELESSIESFDQLFEGPVGFGFFVEVLQADDGVVFDARDFFGAFFVHEVDAGGIRRVSIGD